MKSRAELNEDKQKAIVQEEKKEAQKKLVKRIVLGLLLLFILVFSSCLYVVKIGTTSLIVKEEMITSSLLPASFHGLKMIQFSDLHFDDETLLQKTVKEIVIRKPDVLVFTGDLLNGEDISTKKRQRLVKELRKIEVTLGKYAVLGESDDTEAISILTDCGFTILDDQAELIYKNSKEPLLLIGLNTEKETPNYEQAFSYYQDPSHNEEIYSILLFHRPDKIEEALATHSVNLALAGHSHLGQINVPKVFSVVSKEGAKKYTEDFYKIGNTQFFISSGIGTSNYPYRLFSRPSITFFRFATTT